jgi:hypothetical protein
VDLIGDVAMTRSRPSFLYVSLEKFEGFARLRVGQEC